MSAVDLDLRAAVAAAIVCAAIVLAVPVTAIRVIFALPLCFYLPGFGLTEALFARRRLERHQGLMLALGLSLVTLVLGALVLNLTPWGLRAGPWSILLVIVVLAGCVVAHRRGGPVLQDWSLLRRRTNRLDVALLLFAALAGVTAFAITRAPLRAPSALGYTELWVAPTGGQADQVLPGCGEFAHRRLTLRDAACASRPPTIGVTIGVRSQEQERTHYRLEVRPGSGDRVVRQIWLSPGQEKLVSIPLPATGIGSRRLLAALLYRSGVPGVYRTVTARIPSPHPVGR